MNLYNSYKINKSEKMPPIPLIFYKQGHYIPNSHFQIHISNFSPWTFPCMLLACVREYCLTQSDLHLAKVTPYIIFPSQDKIIIMRVLSTKKHDGCSYVHLMAAVHVICLPIYFYQ